MNIKETFLKLTEFTTPYGHESDLESILPTGFQKDESGNYFVKIGNSETLFTCHLDNYCKVKEKINHIIEGNIIKTDGTTILGGDNKAGVTAILYMISKGVPGYYYFFIGEEPILSGGLFGSSLVVDNNPELLRSFKRAIAFDRKMKGSIITRQMAQQCCSDEFADSLIEEFSKSGITMQKDKTGYYTDTGNFLELIPECTNISIGVWNEHHNTEWVDISYIEKIAEAACKINWESLPTIREPKWWLDEKDHQSDPEFIKKYSKFKNRKNDAKIFQYISDILDDENYLLMSRWGFEPGKEMVFNNWFEESPVKVKVIDNQVTINGQFFPFTKRLKNSILNKIKKESQ